VAAAAGTAQLRRMFLACIQDGEVAAAPIPEVSLPLQLEAQSMQQ